jgi:hypothetical protein
MVMTKVRIKLEVATKEASLERATRSYNAQLMWRDDNGVILDYEGGDNETEQM